MRYVTHLACAALGFLLAWWIWRDVPAPESYAPAATLPSGAVVAERVPDAPLPPVAREAARELGGTVARAGTVVVQPGPSTSGTTQNQGLRGGEPQYSGSSAGPVDQSAPCLCKPVKLDWSLTSLRDGSSRMSWYTDDGEITEAVDIPVAPVRMRRDRPWAAGVKVSTLKEYGVWVDRDVGRLRVGIEAEQRKDYGVVGWVKAGIRF